jgi:hypothetical protein
VLDSGPDRCTRHARGVGREQSVYREIYDHGLLERQFADAVEARGDVEEVA